MKQNIILIVTSLVLLIYSLILTIENWEIIVGLEINNPKFLKTVTVGTVGLLIGNWSIRKGGDSK